MSNLLEEIIKDKIRVDGPMSVGAFMELALGHPEHGYYMKQDPFGRAGDFVTAPEVSQLFGEMVGVWVADLWIQMGRPAPFGLVECGPGRGTLMADILRACAGVTGFYEAVQVHLIEISPALKGKQETALAGHDVLWHGALESVPTDGPLIVIGNEFLDALAFTQVVRTPSGDIERKIVLNAQGAFAFEPAQGAVFEASPVREAFVKNVCARLKRQGGAALFIDYGHVKSAFGDTFQAIKGHEHVDVFTDVGNADLTSHVDFEALQAGIDVPICGPVSQGDFLRALGIGLRARLLMEKADGQQAGGIEKGLHRLVDSDQMGDLFKVIGFYHHESDIKPAGF